MDQTTIFKRNNGGKDDSKKKREENVVSSIFSGESGGNFVEKSMEMRRFRWFASLFWTLVFAFTLLAPFYLLHFVLGFIPFLSRDEDDESGIIWRFLVFSFYSTVLIVSITIAYIFQFRCHTFFPEAARSKLEILKGIFRENRLTFLVGHVILYGIFVQSSLVHLLFSSTYFNEHPAGAAANDSEERLESSRLEDEYSLLILFALISSFIFAWNFLVDRRYQLAFPPNPERRSKRFKKFLPSVFRNAFLSNLVSLGIFAVVWVLLWLSGSRPWPVFNSIHLNPSSEGIQLPSLPFSFHLLYHLFVTGLLIQLISEGSKRISEIIHTEKFPFEERFLLESIDSNQTYLNMLGWNALSYISREDSDGRQFLYRDNIGEGWKFYFRTCKKILDDMTDAISRVREQRRNLVNDGSKLEDPFKSLQLQVLAIESIAQFTAKSLKEDKIGVVQNNNTVPILLEALFKAKASVDDYIQSLSTAYFPNEMNSYATSVIFKSQTEKPSLNLSFLPKDKVPFDGVPKAQVMHEVLHQAISVVINAFRDRLNYFEFTPFVTPKLQSYVN